MLKLLISSDEEWDENNECFTPPISETVQLEHSLISIAKWESKYHKPYIATDIKTLEENLYYIECMVLSSGFDPKLLRLLSDANLESIGAYINNPMTATIVNKPKTQGGKKEILTSELLYYYMTAFNIPVEFHKWHLNRLLTLINVCDAKQQPETQLSQQEAVSRNAAQNAAMRAKYNSKG